MDLGELIINVIFASMFAFIWAYFKELEYEGFIIVCMFHILLFNQITIGNKISKISE